MNNQNANTLNGTLTYCAGKQQPIVFSTDYDSDFLADIKSTGCARWSSLERVWSLPAHLLDRAFELAESYGIPITEGFLQAAQADRLKREATQPRTAQPPKEPQGRVVVLDGPPALLGMEHPYDPDFIQAVKKTVKGARWNGELKIWTAPMTSEPGVKEVAKMFNMALPKKTPAPGNQPPLAAELAGAIEHTVADKIVVPGLKAELRNYQKVGVCYIRSQGSVILADEMGTGKTLQSLAGAVASGKLPALVICPASLRINWQRETQAFFPDLSVAVVGIGGKAQRERELDVAASADVAIINFDILRTCYASLQSKGILDRVRSLIVDEAHYVKSLKSQRGQCLKDVAKALRKVGGLIVLATGTPVINRPKDLIAPLQLMGKLDSVFGGWLDFVTRYCDAEETRYGWSIDGVSHLDELEARLREHCYIRRTKQQVLPELPEKQRTTLPVELSGAVGREYASAEKAFSGFMRKGNGENFSDADLLGNEETERETLLTHTGRLRQIVGRAKVDMVVDLVSSILESGERVIVFGIHIEVQELLFAALGKLAPAARITGSMNPHQRQAEVDRFQAGDAQVIICSQKAAGVGLTLTAASQVVFAEYDWTAASHDQAEDRAHRIGQRKSVNIWYVHATDTIDDGMQATVNYKREIARDVTGDSRIMGVELASERRADMQRLLDSVADRHGTFTKKERKRAQKAGR